MQLASKDSFCPLSHCNNIQRDTPNLGADSAPDCSRHLPEGKLRVCAANSGETASAGRVFTRRPFPGDYEVPRYIT
jgi:hypothetical protein